MKCVKIYLTCTVKREAHISHNFENGLEVVAFHGCNKNSLQETFFSHAIVAVSFIGGGNRSTQWKPPTCRKSPTNFITWCCFVCAGFELTTLVMIGTDCICSCKSNYLKIVSSSRHNWFIFNKLTLLNFLYHSMYHPPTLIFYHSLLQDMIMNRIENILSTLSWKCKLIFIFVLKNLIMSTCWI
jgi:hypothetical protein